MDTRFAVTPYDYAAAERLAADLGVSHVLAQVLVRRGLGDPAAARAFLAAADAHPLDAFGGLREAARARSSATSRGGSRITVHGDYDVDGVCRHGDPRARAAHARRRRRLVPAEPDRRRVRARRARPSSGSPPAGPTCWSPSTARSPPSRRWRRRAPRGSTSWSPTTTRRARTARCRTRRSCTRASAATRARTCARRGVAHKLAQALLEGAGEDPRCADEDLDLVALATVADVVPLVGENRRLVRDGLHALAKTRKPGLRALMEIARVDPSAVDAARSASGSRRGSTPPAGCTAPTPASSCCSPRIRRGRARSPPSSTR